MIKAGTEFGDKQTKEKVDGDEWNFSKCACDVHVDEVVELKEEKLPKVTDEINYKVNKDDEWLTATATGRAGKPTGKYAS